MDICTQTLVLADNDLTVSDVNAKLSVATLKYMFYHSPENMAYSFNTYEHDIVGEERYVTDVNDLVCSVDTMEFTAKDQNIIDTLSEVIKRWQESDFACRNIVVFTDGIEGEAINHEKEELYYLINNTDYPIYVVFLNQENNISSRKTLSAIATTSGGALFESEFSGDDAEVDRLLTEKLFNRMNEYCASYWKGYETSAENAENAEIAENADNALTAKNTENVQSGSNQAVHEDADEKSEALEALEADSEIINEDISVYDYLEGTGEDVIMRSENSQGFLSSPKVFLFAGMGLCMALVIVILGGMYVMKLRRKKDGDINLSEKGLKSVNSSAICEDEDKTVLFSRMPEFDEDEYATRLLTNDNAKTVTLTECSEGGKSYRIYLGCEMSIGRKTGECDVVIDNDDALSKCHCLIRQEKDEVFIKDLESSNGTFVNGKRIAEACIYEGDEVKIGSKSYYVRFA